MTISIRPQGDVRIIEFKAASTLEGEGAVRAPEPCTPSLSDLRQTLGRLLDQGCRWFVLDLGQVTFLDSAGFGDLVACRKRTIEKGGDILLLHPAGKVRERLEMLHLNHLFGVFTEESEALAWFNRKEAPHP